jgi:TonB-linked SusC/RagA family outer membrane protein
MKTKFNGILTLLLAFMVQMTFAQERTISGTVSDESGPLPGVSVLVDGTTRGTETNFNGQYTISANVGQVLRFSFVGMTSVTKTVGTDAVINVTMASGENTLDEVVVTALGIEREKKSLGYATQEVTGDKINTAKDVNFVNGLSGKVAGLDVKSSGTLGGSSNVIIRGYSSLTGDNQALFVIDGVPVDNSNTNSGNVASGRGGYDYGNAATDINPDDIESVNVLKGGAATALYGSRAANGVIVITTKKGKDRGNKGIGVSVSSNITFSKFNEDTFAKYQHEYGAGYGTYYDDPTGYFFLRDVNEDGVDDLTTPSTEDASYGAQFDPNLLVYQWDSWYPQLDTYQQPRPWLAGENDPTTFFQTGHTYFNGVAIDGATEKGYFRLGYTNTNTEGILPNSEIIRDNVDFGGSLALNDKWTASVKASYIKTKGKGRYGTGYSSQNPMQQMRQWWQTNVDVQEQKAAYFQTRENITWNTSDAQLDLAPIYSDNPYWTRYENFNTDGRDRIIGNVALDYKIADWISLFGRVSIDNYNEIQEERINVNSSDVAGYTRYNRNYNENNYDFMVNFNKDFSENINLLATAGTNIRRTSVNSIYAATNGGLNLPGLYSLENSANPIAAPTESAYDLGVDGIFATASLGFANTIYLEGSVRQDKFSTLPRDNDTALYWGASVSFVFSSLLGNSNWLSLGKLRAGYATTGNGAPAYSVSNTYILNTPVGGQPTADLPGQNANSELKPETSNELEVGLEMAFFKNRFGFDASYYDKESVDLITPLTITAATGFTSQSLNAGKVSNTGFEISGWLVPVRTENFEWRIDVNWAKNENEVLELPADLESILLASVQGGVNITARVGQPYGTIEGTDLTYDEASGKPIVNSSGYWVRTTTKPVIGNFQPDWKGGLNNTFNYKSLKFSFLLDMQKGGDVFSLDQWYGQATGLYPESVGLNDLGNPLRNTIANGGGVILDAVYADGTPNTTRARTDYYANPYGYARAANSMHVYDAGYIKLREITLGYTLPQEWFGGDKGIVQGLTVTAIGRNLWIIDSDVPYADPEAGLSSGNVQGYQSGAYPSTKDYGFSIKIDF